MSASSEEPKQEKTSPDPEEKYTISIKELLKNLYSTTWKYTGLGGCILLTLVLAGSIPALLMSAPFFAILGFIELAISPLSRARFSANDSLGSLFYASMHLFNKFTMSSKEKKAEQSKLLAEADTLCLDPDNQDNLKKALVLFDEAISRTSKFFREPSPQLESIRFQRSAVQTLVNSYYSEQNIRITSIMTKLLEGLENPNFSAAQDKDGHKEYALLFCMNIASIIDPSNALVGGEKRFYQELRQCIQEKKYDEAIHKIHEKFPEAKMAREEAKAQQKAQMGFLEDLVGVHPSSDRRPSTDLKQAAEIKSDSLPNSRARSDHSNNDKKIRSMKL